MSDKVLEKSCCTCRFRETTQELGDDQLEPILKHRCIIRSDPTLYEDYGKTIDCQQYKVVINVINDVKDHERFWELIDHRESLKSHRLSNKMASELREIVDRNCENIFIHSYNPEATNEIKELLRKNGIPFKRTKLPDTTNFTFF